MSYPQNSRLSAIAAKVETTTNVDAVPTFAANAVRLLQPFDVEPGFIAPNGISEMATGGIGQPAPIPPGGPFRRLRGRVAPNGHGSAYSSSNLPELHPFLLAMGYTYTVVTTPGAEKVTYSLVDDPSSTITMYAEQGGKKDIITGAVVDSAQLTLNAGTFPVLELSAVGAFVSQSEQALEAATYNTTPPPVYQGALSIQMGAYTPIVRSVTVQWGLSVATRGNANAAAGHSGYKITRRAPTIHVRAEVDALSAWDPYNDWKAANLMSIAIIVGATQYAKMQLTAQQCAITNIAPADENGLRVLDVTYAVTSPPGGAQELDWLFN